MAEKNCVDLSYSPYNILKLDSHARANGTIIIPDAGIAPGVSNLVAGRALNTGYNSIKMYVGGFAKDKDAPLGYSKSWSTDDLLEEFVRPVRIWKDGEVKTVDAMSEIEKVCIPGVGILDAFYTDGLRTLLYYKRHEMMDRKVTVTEKTMRREGHMEEVMSLIKSGTFKEYVEKNCVSLEDMLAMRVEAGSEVVDMVVSSDDEMSAMARSTALSCSVFVQMIAEGKLNRTGVIPPEALSEDAELYADILDRLLDNGISFTTKYPFLQ
jgi:saccharopine dehydrogenase-like NADP-dependent oxidoreductase